MTLSSSMRPSCRRAFLRADMDNGPEGSPHSRERSEPRPHRHARTDDLVASTGAGNQRLKMFSNIVPLDRLGTPKEIARAVVFLASDDSNNITGTELFVDGGMAQV